MIVRTVSALVVGVLLAGAATLGTTARVAAPAGAASGVASASRVRGEPAPDAGQPKAAITFDVDTGRVVDAENDRTPVGVASTIKLLTALVVVGRVPMDDQVPVTAQAAAVSPLKLSMEPGSHWRADDLLHAMLIASLNDTAMALAIRAGGGTIEGFHRAAAEEVRRLALADHPVVDDPAGLDGPDSVDGGNLISARDLAIVTRAFLRTPSLAAIVRMASYRFEGGDGRPHVVWNHNAFLSIYPGAIGVKTGYTDRTGHSLVAAATRDGRTLATVVIDSPDPVGFARAHLDAAFGAGPATPGTGDVLPEPTGPAPTPGDRPGTTAAVPTTSVAPRHADVGAAAAPAPSSGSSSAGPWIVVVAIVVVVGAVATLARRVRRRAAAGTRRSGRGRR